MKFQVTSTRLLNQLQAVSRVIGSKSSLAILEDILFQLEGNMLSLTASDGETTIRTSMEVEAAEGSGMVAFGSKILLETFKQFSEVPLTFVIDEQNFGMTISSLNGEYSVVGVNGAEYPQIPLEAEADSHHFTINSGLLLDAISKTIFCTAEDELRPVMNGIFFDLTPEKATLVATDAHRLVRYSNSSVHIDEPASFILPKKPANLLKNVLAKDESEVDVRFGARNVLFTFGNTAIICRLIDGRYPNYNAVIPQNNTNVMTIDRSTMLSACKRVAVFANAGTALIRLALAENSVTVSSQDIDFSTSAEERLVCSYNGMPMAMGFKAPFLNELIATVESDEVMLKLADPARAGLILPAENKEGEELLMLLMPMLLND